ncbi:MAG: radical SAM protein [Bacillota bacterium]
MNYKGKIWRPPSEAKSLIIQLTVGCSHNKCTFCNMYKNKKFHIKKEVEIKKEIKAAAAKYKNIERIFLADGDALIIQFDKLLNILKTINNNFTNLKRITSYSSPKSILHKSLNELKELKQNGLKMTYLGIESGADQILEKINKGANREEIIKAGQKLKKAGIINSSTIILGLGGKEKTKLHAQATASIINQIKPDYLSALTLMLPEDAPLYQDVKNGNFEILTPYQTVIELKEIIKRLDLEEQCIFRSNHASNYYAIKGTLPEAKSDMLKKLEYIIDNPQKYHLKAEGLRSL